MPLTRRILHLNNLGKHKWFININGATYNLPVTYVHQARPNPLFDPTQIPSKTSTQPSSSESEDKSSTVYMVYQSNNNKECHKTYQVLQVDEVPALESDDKHLSLKGHPSSSIQQQLNEGATDNPKEPEDIVSISEDLSQPKQDQVKILVQEVRSVFATSYREITGSNMVTLNVDTGLCPPIYNKPRPLAHSGQQFVQDEIQKLLEEGKITPSQSPWAFPVVVAKHPRAGKRHLCLDFRQLNKITVRDSFPLPQMDDLLDKLQDCNFISCVDLHTYVIQSCNQIQADKETIPKLTMMTPFGTFSYQGNAIWGNQRTIHLPQSNRNCTTRM
jgi:hypothetical protein